MNEVLSMFLGGFLWVDEPWLEASEDSCVYWQHRLAQEIDLRDLGEGTFNWRANTLVVRDVQDAVMADALCLELNDFTAGWSFAYQPSDRTIRAVCTMTAPVSWDRYVVRFSEAAKLSSWFSDRIAENLSAEVGGKPAFSHPSSQLACRDTPDAVYSLMNVVRERPEWIFDPTPYMYPELADIADFFAELMGGTADNVEVDGPHIWISTLDSRGDAVSHVVHCAFLKSSVFGGCWNSDVTFPSVSPSPEGLRNLIWHMYESRQMNLLGGWTLNNDQSVRFAQVTLSGEIRALEKLGSFITRDSQVLWGLTSTLSDAIGAALSQLDSEPPAVLSQVLDRMDVREAARRVLSGLRSGESELLSAVPTKVGDKADRRMLWLRPNATLMTCAWFNPIGPTLSTLEIVEDSATGHHFLVEYMRHPFGPRYRVLAQLDESAGLHEVMEQAVSEVIIGSVPMMVTFESCPEDALETVMDAFRTQVEALSGELDHDLLVEARLLARTRGRPWEWASTTEDTRQQAFALNLDDVDPYRTWLEQASHPDHVTAVLGQLPEAWDGALNYQMSLGNMSQGHFDTSPLFVTYSTIGVLSPDEIDS